jgi:hypothetical protein
MPIRPETDVKPKPKVPTPAPTITMPPSTPRAQSSTANSESQTRLNAFMNQMMGTTASGNLVGLAPAPFKYGKREHDSLDPVYYDGMTEYYQEFATKWTDPKWRANFVLRSVAAGLMTAKSGMNYMDAFDAWKQLGSKSMELAGNGVYYTPMTLLSMSSGGRVVGSGRGGGSSFGGHVSRFSTSTYTSENITKPETAKALAQAVLTAALGRNATDAEIGSLGTALRSYEAKNPTVQTSTTDNLHGTSSSKTTGGVSDVDRQAFMHDQIWGGALHNEAAANTMADYMDSFEQMLKGA